MADGENLTTLEILETKRFSPGILGPLPITWNIFAAEVASGEVASDAAISAGYGPGYANDLLARSNIRAKISQLIADYGQHPGIASRLWIETQFVKLLRDSLKTSEAQYDDKGNCVMPAVPANRELARGLLNDIARLNGFIVKQSLSVNAQAGSRNDVGELLDDMLAEMSPGERERIKEQLRPRRRGRTVNAETVVTVSAAPITPESAANVLQNSIDATDLRQKSTYSRKKKRSVK